MRILEGFTTITGFHRKYAMRSSVDRLPTIARGMTAVTVTSRGSSVQVNTTLSLSSTRSARSSHLADCIAYNYARRLKTLKGLTPYERICNAGLPSQNDSNSIRSSKCRD
jgi:hypothetical protein